MNGQDVSKARLRSAGIPILVITLFGFALRLYHLDYFSLRGDEAFDVLYAAQPLAEIILQDRLNQPYPPFYHTALHYWLLLAGRGEFALRWIMGVVPGTLVVPLTGALAHRLFGRATAWSHHLPWLTALLAAINPYLLWWSQDAHFYALLAMFAASITLLAFRLWEAEGDWRVWWLYTLTTALGFYTHYYTCFSWGAVNLLALWHTLTRGWSRRLATRWWLAQAVAVALYSPWLVASFGMISRFVQTWMQYAGPLEILQRNLVAYSLHLAGAERWATGVVFLTGVIFVAGTFPWRWRPGRPADSETRRLLTLLVLIFAPLVVLYLGSLQRPLYDEKLTIFILPHFLVALARGLVVIGGKSRALGAVIALLLTGPMLVSDYSYFFDPSYAKSPAWRELMSYVHREAQPGDLLIYNFPEPSVLYYNDERLPIALIPDSAGLSADEIGEQVERAAASYRRVWLVPLVRPWWDAHGDTLTWLDRHADRVDQVFFRGANVNLYLTPSAWQAAMIPQSVRFAEGIRLRGFRLTGEEVGAGQVTLSPGGRLRLSLYWQADGPTDTPYTVFTHLMGPDGRLYGQWDNPPVRGTYPTTDWSPGESIVDQYEIPLMPDAPAGEYHLVVGLYDPITGARLPVLDDWGKPTRDYVRLATAIRVTGE